MRAAALGLGLAAAAALALAGCHRGALKAGGAHTLVLSVDPPSPNPLDAGTLVRVTARPEPKVEMAWVSGTVKIFGAPVAPFKRDREDGSWRFKTMVPPMVTVPPGTYQIKAWGRTVDGEEIHSAISYEVQ